MSSQFFQEAKSWKVSSVFFFFFKILAILYRPT
jgi:hypothetical protein